MDSGSNLPIAVLIDTLDDEYQVAVVRGALSAARDLGVPVLCVPGGRVRDGGGDRAARNVGFELANADTARGIVAVTSVIGSAVGVAELGTWLERYGKLPLCVVGVPIPKLAYVEVDNSSGIRELVLHLARAHGRRRLAFIQGPSGSAEARVRFDAFCAALGEVGLEFDPRLAVEGDFRKPSGADAVRTLLDGQGPADAPIDGIVAANDYMALGAMQELVRRHIDVPGSVSVVGFDDVDSARFVRPALTTASQPTEELGRRGVQGVFELAKGRPFDTLSLPTKLILRSSCGCPAAEIGLAGTLGTTGSRSVETSFVERRQMILAEMARAAAGRLGAAGAGWEARLLDALTVEVRGIDSATFYRAVEQMLLKLERSPIDGIVLQDVLTALRRQSLLCVAGVPAARDNLEEALHEARVLTGVYSEEASGRRARNLREIERSFEAALREVLFKGAAELSRAAAERLPDFGVDACVVASLDVPGDAKSGASVLFGFGPRGHVRETERTSLQKLSLHPLFEGTGRVRVALPLVAFGAAVGAAVISTSRAPDHELEELREFLGGALDTHRRAR